MKGEMVGRDEERENEERKERKEKGKETQLLHNYIKRLSTLS